MFSFQRTIRETKFIFLNCYPSDIKSNKETKQLALSSRKYPVTQIKVYSNIFTEIEIPEINRHDITQKKADVNLSTFGFLFSQIIQYHSSKKRNVEEELRNMGESIGVRLLELIYLRSGKLKKETKHLDMLQFIANTVWKTLFGKNADGLFPEDGVKYGYLIRDDSPIVLRHISEVQGQNGAAFIVGIIKGMLNHSGFEATVDYDTIYKDDENEKEVSLYPATYFSIKFSPSVVEREK